MKRRIPLLVLLSLALAAIGAGVGLRAGDEPAPGLPADFHRGVNHAHVHARGHGYGSPASQASLGRLARLGVDSVALTVFGYQRRADDADLLAPAPDPTLAGRDLVREIRAAHDLGMRVLLKPHVWSHDFWEGDEWHGTIRQRDAEAHARWWAAYRRMLLEQARLAHRERVEVLCLGTELVRMTAEHPDEWRALIEEIRAMPAGPDGHRPALTYAAHWERELEAIPFWDALDAIGVAAYFPLDAPVGATVAELEAAWAPHRDRLAALARRNDRPAWFLEVGYRSVAGTHLRPWTTRGGERDVAAQARAYEAMFRALHDAPWWRGAYLWKSFSDPAHRSERGDGTGFRFQEEPTTTVLHQWFSPVDSGG